MGAETGALKLHEGSSSITCRGRQLQKALARTLEENFGVVEIYGDTDSSMVSGKKNVFPDSQDGLLIESADQAYRLGKLMEDHLNGGDGFIGEPIRVELEKVMKMLSVHKKMYAYLEYSRESDGGPSKYVLDEKGEMSIVSKELMSARRNSCRACKEAFTEVLKLVLTDAEPKVLLLEVAELVRKFLSTVDDSAFHKTVEIADTYVMPGCANSVFKKNMLDLGTKIEAKSRVKYVIVVSYRGGSRETHNTGDKMLLLKYFDPDLHSIDRVHYLRQHLKKPMDEVVSLATPTMGKSLKLPGRGMAVLNRPVDTILKLIKSTNACWDMGGLKDYISIVNNFRA